jgi:geranylgeranyl diphosphate synthase type II
VYAAIAEDDCSLSQVDFDAYLAESRTLALDEIRRFVRDDSPFGEVLYDLVMDYPLRPAKGLRPALCLATCRALGGSLSAALPSAAVLELYHNAFLIHDDVEDGSESRRGGRTLHAVHGASVAVNVGDAMLALAMEPLLDNVRLVGLGKALRVLQAVAQMARGTAEGQALELMWAREGASSLEDEEYVRLAESKTALYSFVTPITVGAILGGATPAQIEGLGEVGRRLGVAFQIQDDLLNLTGDEGAYGKERYGDLWEGKHTLALAHMLRHAPLDRRAQAESILRKRRALPRSAALGTVRALVERLAAEGEMSARARRELAEGLENVEPCDAKTLGDVEFLFEQMVAQGSIEHARRVSADYAREAAASFRCLSAELPASVHRQFLWSLIDFAVHRDW